MANATTESLLRVNALEVEVKMLREMLEAMREDRNAWHGSGGQGHRGAARAGRPSQARARAIRGGSVVG